MSSSTSSAEPRELSHYSTSAIHLDLDVLTTSHRLAGVLHQFEATCTEPAFRVRVSHVADVMGGHARSAEPVDRWVNTVGQGFRMADSRALPTYLRILLTTPVFGHVAPSLTPLGRLIAAIQREEFPNLFPMPVVLPSPIETPGIHANPHALNGAFNNVHNALGRALHSISRLIFALRWRRIIDVIRNPPWLHWPWPRLPWPSWPRITIPEKPGAWRGLLPFIPGIPRLVPKAPEIISPTPAMPETKTPPQKTPPTISPSIQPGPQRETQPPSSWNEPPLRQDNPTGDPDILKTERIEANGRHETNPFTKKSIKSVKDHINAYGCLLTAFTMLLNSHGYKVSMTDMYMELYKKKTGKDFDKDAKDGTITLGDLIWESGPITSITDGQFKEVSAEIDKSAKSFDALIKENGPIAIEVLMGPSKHWIVVDGYDAKTGKFFIRDPLKGQVKGKIPGDDYKPSGKAKYIKAKSP